MFNQLMKKMLCYFMLLCITARSLAQCGDSLKSVLMKDWERAKVYTKEYLQAMPDGKYGFHPNDSIRNFAAQMLHLARMNFLMISFATGDRSSWMQRNIEKVPALEVPDSVRILVIASYDFAIHSIGKMNPDSLFRKNKIGQFDLFRFDWIMKAFEHQTHTRGQTTIYLRMAEIVPPDEKLL